MYHLYRMRVKVPVKPVLYQIPQVSLPEPQMLSLANGLAVYVLADSSLDLLKLEWLIEAGRPHEQQKLSARATAKMLREGNRNQTAAQFAELLDFHGASLVVPNQMDIADIQLYTLAKHSSALIPAMADAIQFPAFGKLDFDTFVRNAIAELSLETGRPEAMAYRYLTEFLYGTDHPYGYNSTPQMYEALTTDHLRAFHKRRYSPATSTLILSGNVTAKVLDIVQDSFGSWTNTEADVVERNLPKAQETPPQKRYLPLKHTDQIAIKIGRRMFNRHHPDFAGVNLLNTVLGGYFGSRLMTQVREKKGLTYNIYSSFDLLRDDGFLYIGSEVNKRKRKQALTAIYDEMKRLQDHAIPTDELQMVKNYLAGMMLMSTDGPLNQGNLLKSLVIDGLSPQDFAREQETWMALGPEQLLVLAQKWLDTEHYWEVIV